MYLGPWISCPSGTRPLPRAHAGLLPDPNHIPKGNPGLEQVQWWPRGSSLWKGWWNLDSGLGGCVHV